MSRFILLFAIYVWILVSKNLIAFHIELNALSILCLGGCHSCLGGFFVVLNVNVWLTD